MTIYCENCETRLELSAYKEDVSTSIEITIETYKCPNCGRVEEVTTIWKLLDSGK